MIFHWIATQQFPRARNIALGTFWSTSKIATNQNFVYIFNLKSPPMDYLKVFTWLFYLKHTIYLMNLHAYFNSYLTSLLFLSNKTLSYKKPFCTSFFL